MPVAHPVSEFLAGWRQEHAAIRPCRSQALALQSLDALDCGGVRHAEPAGDIRGPCLALRRQKVGNQLGIILK
jgi:hypothetical protein